MERRAGGPGLTGGLGSRRCTVLCAVPRAPKLMAAPGTRGAGVALATQKEVVLERPCWLDGGCEQARRGYLYGQLCCVGGCMRLEGGGAGGVTCLCLLVISAGCCPAQVQPHPQAQFRKHLGRKAE